MPCWSQTDISSLSCCVVQPDGIASAEHSLSIGVTLSKPAASAWTCNGVTASTAHTPTNIYLPAKIPYTEYLCGTRTNLSCQVKPVHQLLSFPRRHGIYRESSLRIQRRKFSTLSLKQSPHRAIGRGRAVNRNCALPNEFSQTNLGKHYVAFI